VRTSFLHLADTRLGFRDPADPTVFVQVAKQFRFAIDYALDQRAAFVVFSGNLFEGADLDPDALQVVLRGLERLAEKNVSAIAIRGQRDARHQPGVMTWYEMLSQENLLASLEVGLGDGQMALRRWERREGSGSYVDLGRCRVFGLPYYGSMTSPLVQAMAKSVAGLDNREMDFRVILLHGALEHFSDAFGPKLSYSDVLMLRRHVDYVALGGCDSSYEAEAWVYNPGPNGFYHVSVDTAVQPKHHARYVAYPSALAVSRPAPSPPRPSRRLLEESIFDELVNAGSGSEVERTSRRDVLRLVTQSMWGAADAVELRSRLMEAAARGPEDEHAA
jgi:hypothetical protein